MHISWRPAGYITADRNDEILSNSFPPSKNKGIFAFNFINARNGKSASLSS